MRSMRVLLFFAAPLVVTGCAPLYEEVPAFGQSDPNSVAVADRQPQQQATYSYADNPSQTAVDPGQAVNGDDGQQEYTDTDPSALTEFKSTLDPYGTWSDDTQYGTVWQPDPGVVGSDFAPYVTGGHWSYDSDYTWVSDYDWGWAPFHYGRWVYIAGRGWCWIAGRRYAGAWVSWRVGAEGYGYVGWGPLAPSWYWRGGYAYDIGWGVNTPYTFCRTGDLFSPTLHGRTLAGPEVTVVAGNTRPYTDGRTPAHPTVGPPLNHLGLIPPAIERSPGILRARALSHPSHGPQQIQAMPSYVQPRGTIGSGSVEPPIVTAPRYNGVMPQPYHAAPTYRPPVQMAPPQNYANAQPYGRSMPPPQSYGNAQPYGRPASPPPMYRSPPVYHGGGNFGGGGGGGYRPPVTTTVPQYHPPSYSSSSSSHSSSSSSYTHSHGGGGGGGGGRHR